MKNVSNEVALHSLPVEDDLHPLGKRILILLKEVIEQGIHHPFIREQGRRFTDSSPVPTGKIVGGFSPDGSPYLQIRIPKSDYDLKRLGRELIASQETARNQPKPLVEVGSRVGEFSSLVKPCHVGNHDYYVNIEHRPEEYKFNASGSLMIHPNLNPAIDITGPRSIPFPRVGIVSSALGESNDSIDLIIVHPFDLANRFPRLVQDSETLARLLFSKRFLKYKGSKPRVLPASKTRLFAPRYTLKGKGLRRITHR